MRFRLRYSEIDSHGNLTIVSLINYLQDVVTFQSDEVGCTLSYNMEHGWGWFITSWEIYINRLPAYGESIEIDTWPTRIKGVLAHRDIVVYDENAKELVRARSLWVLMDLKASRPIRVPEDIADRFIAKKPLDGVWKGRRVGIMDGVLSGEPGQMIEVLHLHLDTNGHMNNAYYIEIAKEQIPEGKRICSIRIEYKKPAVLGDRIMVHSAGFGELMQVALVAEDGGLFSVVEFQVA